MLDGRIEDLGIDHPWFWISLLGLVGGGATGAGLTATVTDGVTGRPNPARPGPYFSFFFEFDLYNSGTNSWSHNQVRSPRKPHLLNPAKSSKCTAISTSIPPCYNGIGYDLRGAGHVHFLVPSGNKIWFEEAGISAS